MTLDAGVQVEVDWRGRRQLLPADIGLSAFRIIQEAVTNVVRHAGFRRAWVGLCGRGGVERAYMRRADGHCCRGAYEGRGGGGSGD
jgi:nitrate/nitrite-specific signal transduction histidine kinase